LETYQVSLTICLLLCQNSVYSGDVFLTTIISTSWSNYLSLYFEFFLLLWITVKSAARANSNIKFFCIKFLPKPILLRFKDRLLLHSVNPNSSHGRKRPSRPNNIANLSAEINDEDHIKLRAAANKSKEIKYRGVPTRLKASIILSIIMCLAFAYR
jgi:hypothetical protein